MTLRNERRAVQQFYVVTDWLNHNNNNNDKISFNVYKICKIQS